MTQDEALQIARQVVTEKEWTWLEPVTVSKRWRLFQGSIWDVVTNSDKIGCNVRIEINDRDGEVVRAAFCPR